MAMNSGKDTEDTLLHAQLDEYQILSLLGQGGMGRVYLGRDVRLERYVTIKVIDRPFRSDPTYVARFEREAQAVAQLEHPHIVRLYRYGETKEILYMVLQYVEGADLGSILASYQQDETFLPYGDVLTIVRDLASALDYAHSKGVIHRDVKPSNVLLNQEGRAILTDFGLALLATTETLGETFGTPHYIAPEQAASSVNVVPQSDLYALGVILYEMLTGTLPFTGRGPAALVRQHLHEQPPPPRLHRSQLEPDVEAVVLKALAKEPGARYQSGASLAAALESALAGQPAATLVAPPRSLGDHVSDVYDAQPVSPAVLGPATTDFDTTVPERRGTLPTQPVRVTAVEPPPPDPPVARAAAPPRRRRPAWLAALILFLCVGAALVALVANSLGGETPGLPAATVAVPTSETVAETKVPTPTSAPSATSAPTATPEVPALLIATNGNESLFLVNDSASPVRLAGLRLGEGQEAISGIEWQLVFLDPGDCVTVWKEKGNPDPPSVSCNVVGELLQRRNRDVFWDKPFSVFYRDELLGVCRNSTCSLPLPVSVTE